MGMRAFKLKPVVWLIIGWLILVISCNGGDSTATPTPIAPPSPVALVAPPTGTPVSQLVPTVSAAPTHTPVAPPAP
jgi:hypothetical protein